ncbi:methyltransferase [Williamsoniiplasma somnilux]|uniref:Methyltransferase n=1 Tax=Williamsoniiplasma somnilux TaxID=215578 RepID=A0A2K8NZ51_9MOLU|nr:methyltransferase [Williamsoniiplasma somnilux]ATZ19102.1 methyltransferase [Williamsoniiplasma somnilux]
MKILNELLGYKNLNLYQDTNMFSFTLDSVLVSRFINLNSKIKTIVDFGTNNAVIPLIMSKYTNANIIGVEIQDKAIELANKNIMINNLDNQIQIIHQDIKDFASKANHQYDAVICNPPFFKTEGNPKLNETSLEIVNARHETLINLEEIIKSGAMTIKNGGSFTIVHRAERSGEIISLFTKYNIVPKRLQFVHSKVNKNGKTVLIDGILNGNEGMVILPPLISHHDDETYTDEMLKMFRD